MRCFVFSYFSRRKGNCTYHFRAFSLYDRQINFIFSCILPLHLSCYTIFVNSAEKGVSDPPFRVYEKMKQGSATIFMVTAVSNRRFPDMFSFYFLKGGRVPGKPPSKNDFPQKSLFISDFRQKFQTFFFPETAFSPRFPS